MDGASLGLIAIAGGGGRTTGREGAIVAGTLGYFFGAPTVHWAHGNLGTGFGSLGIRAGATAVALAGVATCSPFGESSGCSLFVLGFLGMVAAIPIDAAALAYEDEEDDEARIRWTLSPAVGSLGAAPAGLLEARAPRAALTSPTDVGLVLRGVF